MTYLICILLPLTRKDGTNSWCDPFKLTPAPSMMTCCNKELFGDVSWMCIPLQCWPGRTLLQSTAKWLSVLYRIVI